MAKSKGIPKDCEFPQLDEIVQPEVLSRTLQQRLGDEFAAGGLHVDGCKIEKVRYKRGSDCRILFEAEIGGRNGSAKVQQMYFATVYDSQKARAVYESIDAGRLVQPKHGPAVALIPEWDMVLWAYPNDPRLPGLSLLVAPEQILDYGREAPERLGLAGAPRSVAARLTKYVPSKRCGYIYNFSVPNGKSEVSKSVYAKAYHAGEGENAYRVTRQIWESDACQNGDFSLPEPYSYDPAYKIIWQETLPGKPLAKIAGNQAELPELAKAVGRSLAAFHNIAVDLPQEMTLDFQMQEVGKSIAAIAGMFPERGSRVQGLGERLEAAAAELGPGVLTPVHASFKFSHIFVTEHGVAFIDFDSANLGDPGYDLGRFIAHIYKLQINRRIEASTAEAAIANFCDAYNNMAATPMLKQRIDWFTGSHLVASELYKSVKRIDPELLDRLLETIERMVSK